MSLQGLFGLANGGLAQSALSQSSQLQAQNQQHLIAQQQLGALQGQQFQQLQGQAQFHMLQQQQAAYNQMAHTSIEALKKTYESLINALIIIELMAMGVKVTQELKSKIAGYMTQSVSSWVTLDKREFINMIQLAIYNVVLKPQYIWKVEKDEYSRED